MPEEKVLSGKPVASHFMGVASSDLELPESYYTSEASLQPPHPVKGIAIRPEHALERIQARISNGAEPVQGNKVF